MNRLTVKIILAIAIGVLVGTVFGNLESNKIVTYHEPTANGNSEISKDRYESDLNNKFNTNDSFRKISFNVELGFYYGAITSSSTIILLLIPSLIKKQDD
jgi:hypothetical protein